MSAVWVCKHVRELILQSLQHISAPGSNSQPLLLSSYQWPQGQVDKWMKTQTAFIHPAHWMKCYSLLLFSIVACEWQEKESFVFDWKVKMKAAETLDPTSECAEHYLTITSIFYAKKTLSQIKRTKSTKCKSGWSVITSFGNIRIWVKICFLLRFRGPRCHGCKQSFIVFVAYFIRHKADFYAAQGSFIEHTVTVGRNPVQSPFSEPIRAGE